MTNVASKPTGGTVTSSYNGELRKARDLGTGMELEVIESRV